MTGSGSKDHLRSITTSVIREIEKENHLPRQLCVIAVSERYSFSALQTSKGDNNQCIFEGMQIMTDPVSQGCRISGVYGKGIGEANVIN